MALPGVLIMKRKKEQQAVSVHIHLQVLTNIKNKFNQIWNDITDNIADVIILVLTLFVAVLTVWFIYYAFFTPNERWNHHQLENTDLKSDIGLYAYPDDKS